MRLCNGVGAKCYFPPVRHSSVAPLSFAGLFFCVVLG